MKKITKILLPIASTAAVVAPVACMTSCSMMAKVNASVDTNGVSFTITVVFNEEIPEEKHECYSFLEGESSDIYTISDSKWKTDNKTVDILCELNETHTDGEKISFRFSIHYLFKDKDHKEESTEIYPCHTTYRSGK